MRLGIKRGETTATREENRFVEGGERSKLRNKSLGKVLVRWVFECHEQEGS
jgi:hypothetical protein